jgi:hypothetical protein
MLTQSGSVFTQLLHNAVTCMSRFLFFGIPEHPLYFSLRDRSDRQATILARVIFPKMTAKNTLVWNVAPCSLVDCYRYFGGIYFLHVQGKRQYVPPELR